MLKRTVFLFAIGLLSASVTPAQSRDLVEMPVEFTAQPVYERGNTDQMLAALKSLDPTIRFSAFMTLMRRRDPRTYPALTAMIDDPERSIREIATDLLEKFDDPAILPAVVPMLHRPDAASRGLAVKMLFRLCGTNSFDGIVPLLADSDSGVRLKVVRALGQIGDDRCVGLLISELPGSVEGVRDAALEELVKLTGQNYGLDVRKWNNRPRAYGVSTNVLSPWTALKLLLLLALVFLCQMTERPWIGGIIYFAYIAMAGRIVAMPANHLLEISMIGGGLAMIYFWMLHRFAGEGFLWFLLLAGGTLLVVI